MEKLTLEELEEKFEEYSELHFELEEIVYRFFKRVQANQYNLDNWIKASLFDSFTTENDIIEIMYEEYSYGEKPDYNTSEFPIKTLLYSDEELDEYFKIRYKKEWDEIELRKILSAEEKIKQQKIAEKKEKTLYENLKKKYENK